MRSHSRLCALAVAESFAAVVPVTAGGALYLLFRPERLTMFAWVGSLGGMATVDRLRHASAGFGRRLPDLLIYSAPNGLWLLSYGLLLGLIWRRRSIVAPLLWLSALYVLALLSELLQGTGVLRGRFDTADIVAYSVGAAVAGLYIVSRRQHA